MFAVWGSIAGILDPAFTAQTTMPPEPTSQQTSAGATRQQTVQYQLVIEKGENAGNRYTIHERLVIGRDPKADLPLLDQKVSRAHAVVEQQGYVCFLNDMGSTNGTEHNGKRLAERVQLNPNDLIQVGDHILRLVVA